MSRPISRVLSRTVIHLGDASPHHSCDLPKFECGHTPRSKQPHELLFGLAPRGVFPAIVVTNNAVRSYRTFSPLPNYYCIEQSGGIFSVALSVGSRLPEVIWLSAHGARTFLCVMNQNHHTATVWPTHGEL